MKDTIIFVTLFLLLLINKSALGTSLVVDDFSGPPIRITSQARDGIVIRQTDLPDVLGGARVALLGTLSPEDSAFAAVEDGLLKVGSRLGAEAFTLRYGSATMPPSDFQLALARDDILELHFTSFQTERPHMFHLAVSGADNDATSNVTLVNSDSPFVVQIPLSTLTPLSPTDLNQFLRSIDGFVLGMSPLVPMTSIELDEVRIVPEPCTPMVITPVLVLYKRLRRRTPRSNPPD